MPTYILADDLRNRYGINIVEVDTERSPDDRFGEY